MARVKRGVTSHAKHKKVFELTKGHVGGRSTRIREAKSSLLHAGSYAYVGRKQRKRQMRRSWISQLNIALDNQGISYSKFIAQMKAKNIIIDRKMLAEIVVKHPEDFKQIVEKVIS